MPFKQTSLSIGALLGKLKGVHLPGLLREKKIISGLLLGPGSFFLLLLHAPLLGVILHALLLYLQLQSLGQLH
jgi:hypothetical protein